MSIQLQGKVAELEREVKDLREALEKLTRIVCAPPPANPGTLSVKRKQQ